MSVTEPQPAQLNAIAHAHMVWISGLRAGRDSMYLCETLEEAEARSPYLIDGQDPVEITLEEYR